MQDSDVRISYEVRISTEFFDALLKVVETARDLYGEVEDPDEPSCDDGCNLCDFEQALLSYDKLKDKILLKD